MPHRSRRWPRHTSTPRPTRTLALRTRDPIRYDPNPLTTRRLDVPDVTGSYIDGAWREPGAGQTFAVVDPADGTTIADFGIASREDCLAAIEAAAAAGPAWAATPPRERSEILRRAFEILRSERQELAQT